MRENPTARARPQHRVRRNLAEDGTPSDAHAPRVPQAAAPPRDTDEHRRTLVGARRTAAGAEAPPGAHAARAAAVAYATDPPRDADGSAAHRRGPARTPNARTREEAMDHE
ncbi:hypothetical protein GCM10009801_11430 [Streptomyces albiaxialis]|uniref:Uncharacterized protein n=1 Tax=Streptomyces albiaxialis TaxID=329523 RepID=A0ABN2VMR1_9ACTN